MRRTSLADRGIGILLRAHPNGTQQNSRVAGLREATLHLQLVRRDVPVLAGRTQVLWLVCTAPYLCQHMGTGEQERAVFSKPGRPCQCGTSGVG